MAEKIIDKIELRSRLNSMRVKPDGISARKYGVSIKYFDDDEIKPTKRVDYELNANLMVTNGIGEININKENIYFDQHEPDYINEIIANSISKALYPVNAYYNEKGIVSKEIINHQEIIKRWEIEKNTILEKYASEDLDEFFSIFDEKMKNRHHIEKSMQYDWLWNLFFHPVLINYGDNRTIDTEMFLSVIPYQTPLRFVGTQTIEKIPTDYHSFKVDFISKELKAPRYFYPKNAEEELLLFMGLTVNFDLDLYHHFPMHIRAYFYVYSKDWKGEKKAIKRVEFTMYQTNTEEYKNRTLSKKSPFITGGMVTLPPNKWGFDNFENVENDW